VSVGIIRSRKHSRPRKSIRKLPERQQKPEWDKLFATHPGDANLIYLGAIQFLDADGRVTNEFTGSK
jgi:hypothetical protein